MKRSFLTWAISIYYALPPLLTFLFLRGEFSNQRKGLILCGILGILSLTWSLLSFLINKRRVLLWTGAISLLLLILGALLGGPGLHPYFFQWMISLYPGPLLAVTLAHFYRFSRRQQMDQLGKGIGFMRLWLLSYSLTLFLIQLHSIIEQGGFTQGFSLPLGWIEAVNYLPALLLLGTLKHSAGNLIELFSDGIQFRNEDIAESLSPVQQSILRRALEQQNYCFRCRDFAELQNEESLCDQEDFCKASLCNQYAKAYRNISRLNRVLRMLGIGEFQTPENKRDIVKLGWNLVLQRDVELKKNSAPLNSQRQLSSPELQNYRRARRKAQGIYRLPIILILTGSVTVLSIFEVQSQSVQNGSGIYSSPVLLALIGLFSMGIYLLPYLLPYRGKYFIRAFILSLLGQTILWGATGLDLGEWPASYLVIRSIALSALIFMVSFSKIERIQRGMDLRSKAPGALFWLLWFYMAVLVVFKNPQAQGFHEITMMDYSFLMADRLLLIALFLFSVKIYSLPSKALEIQRDSLRFNQEALPGEISQENFLLLKAFLMDPNGVLLCNQAMGLLSPQEKGICQESCKPSACRHYQRIYKRIQVIRRYVETAGIGSILSPQRHQSSREEGWRLVFFEDVYVVEPDEAPQKGEEK